MPIIKIRFSNVVKKIKQDELLWENLRSYIRETFRVDLSAYKIVCTKPKSCVLINQSDLDSLSGCQNIEIELVSNDESMYSQIIRELLDMQSNRNYVIKRFSDVIRQFSSTTLDALLPNSIEPSIKDKLGEIYREASSRCELKTPFRLVYVNEGGRQVLKGLPSSQWINYSTTDINALAKSLPGNVIERLNNK